MHNLNSSVSDTGDLTDDEESDLEGSSSSSSGATSTAAKTRDALLSAAAAIKQMKDELNHFMPKELQNTLIMNGVEGHGSLTQVTRVNDNTRGLFFSKNESFTSIEITKVSGENLTLTRLGGQFTPLEIPGQMTIQDIENALNSEQIGGGITDAEGAEGDDESSVIEPEGTAIKLLDYFNGEEPKTANFYKERTLAWLTTVTQPDCFGADNVSAIQKTIDSIDEISTLEEAAAKTGFFNAVEAFISSQTEMDGITSATLMKCLFELPHTKKDGLVAIFNEKCNDDVFESQLEYNLFLEFINNQCTFQKFNESYSMGISNHGTEINTWIDKFNNELNEILEAVEYNPTFDDCTDEQIKGFIDHYSKKYKSNFKAKYTRDFEALAVKYREAHDQGKQLEMDKYKQECNSLYEYYLSYYLNDEETEEILNKHPEIFPTY